VPKEAARPLRGLVDVELTVNGGPAAVRVPVHRTLLDALRDGLGLTGAKRACNEGTCGACTVLLDGVAVYSCMTLAVRCAGRSVETVEGLARGRDLHPLQLAFIEHDAFQCGYCTSGQLMSLAGLLRRNPAPSEADVREAVSGNLCRCGAYEGIIKAGLAAAAKSS